jgi:NAD+ diphosphatase
VTFEPPRLAQSIFDRAAHRRTDADWLTQAWDRSRVLRVSARSTTPARPAEQAHPPAQVEFVAAAEVAPDAERLFLGVHDDVPYFAVVLEDPGSWVGIRDLGLTGGALELDLLVTAVALVQWHRRHTHCPQCGAATAVEQAGWTRRCPVDASQHFPRTDPAVIMLVHDGPDRCLLGRAAAWAPGRFSTLAGFVEPGESLEAAVEREVFEETAVRASEVRYVASQPWPFPASLMLGFSARADSTLPFHADEVEMAEAAWFTREQVAAAAAWTDSASALALDWTGQAPPADSDVVLQAISPRLSISRYLIDRWLAGALPD